MHRTDTTDSCAFKLHLYTTLECCSHFIQVFCGTVYGYFQRSVYHPHICLYQVYPLWYFGKFEAGGRGSCLAGQSCLVFQLCASSSPGRFPSFRVGGKRPFIFIVGADGRQLRTFRNRKHDKVSLPPHCMLLYVHDVVRATANVWKPQSGFHRGWPCREVATVLHSRQTTISPVDTRKSSEHAL